MKGSRAGSGRVSRFCGEPSEEGLDVANRLLTDAVVCGGCRRKWEVGRGLARASWSAGLSGLGGSLDLPPSQPSFPALPSCRIVDALVAVSLGSGLARTGAAADEWGRVSPIQLLQLSRSACCSGSDTRERAPWHGCEAE